MNISDRDSDAGTVAVALDLRDADADALRAILAFRSERDRDALTHRLAVAYAVVNRDGDGDGHDLTGPGAAERRVRNLRRLTVLRRTGGWFTRSAVGGPVPARAAGGRGGGRVAPSTGVI